MKYKLTHLLIRKICSIVLFTFSCNCNIPSFEYTQMYMKQYNKNNKSDPALSTALQHF